MAAAAYLGTVAAHAEAEAQRQRDQQEAARASQRTIFTAVLGNPNATADQRAYAIDNLNKLNQGAGSKKGQSPYDTLGDHISRVGQHLQDAGHPEASSPGVLHTLPKLDGSAADAAAPMVDASAQQAAVPPAAQSLPSISQDDAAPMAGRDPQGALPAAATADAPPVANAPDKQPPTPQIGNTGTATPPPAAAASLPPLSPEAAHPIGSPAHAFATGVKHGAGKVLQFIGDRMNAAQSAYQQPGINLPPLAPDIDPSMIPSPIPAALKFDPNPIEGASIDPSGVDRFGNQIDPTKKYVAAPDPRGGVMINGRPYSVQTSVPKPSSASPRNLGATISMDDAKNLAQSGQPVLNEHGQPYDLSKVPANMKFQAVGLPGGGVGYLLGTEKQVKRTNGNENYIVNEFEQADPSKYVATGVARTPSTHTAPGIDLDGNIGTVVTGNTPVTTGMSGATPSVPHTLPSIHGGAVIPSTAPGAPNSLPSLHSADGATGIPHPAPPRAMIPQAHQPGAPASSALPFGAANTLQQRIIPVREASTALFGDPETGITPLASFAAIAANPDSSKRVAAAVKTTLNGMEGDAHSGSLWQTMQDATGFSAYKTGVSNAVLGDQLKAMSPQERQAYDSLLTTYSTIIGLRTLTKASAAKFSVEALENELPVPGLNSASKEQFYDQLSRLAQQIKNGAQTLPMKPGEKNFILAQTKKYSDLASGKDSATPTAKEGDTKVNSHGDKVAFHGGKWGPA